MKDDIQSYIKTSIDSKQKLLQDEYIIQSIEATASLMITALSNGQRIYLLGNGGSAADAQHIAAELSGRFQMERKALPVEALTVNSSFVTAVGNDYGFDQIFSRAVEAFVRKGDVVIALTTSGTSVNVINGIKKAKNLDAKTILMTGDVNLVEEVDVNIKAPSKETCIVQEMHIMIGHILCLLVEKSMFA